MGKEGEAWSVFLDILATAKTLEELKDRVGDEYGARKGPDGAVFAQAQRFMNDRDSGALEGDASGRFRSALDRLAEDDDDPAIPQLRKLLA